MSTFLNVLAWLTKLRLQEPWLIYLLPLGGLIVGLLFTLFKVFAGADIKLLIENKNPSTKIKDLIAESMGAWVSHLFGASVGREGVSVYLSLGISKVLKSFFLKLAPDLRDRAFLASGFSVALGSPWAAVIFSFEIARVKPKSFFDVVFIFVTSYLSYEFSGLFRVSHLVLPKIKTFSGNFESWLGILILAGALFLASNLFLWLLKKIKNFLLVKKISFERSLIGGGILISFLYFIVGTDKYAGLGIESIMLGFQNQLYVEDAVFKILFTALAIAFGFRGGEFTPFVWIGLAVASGLNHYLINFIPAEDLILYLALSFVAIYSYVKKIPLTYMVLTLEFFGLIYFPQIALFSFVFFISLFYKSEKWSAHSDS